MFWSTNNELDDLLHRICHNLQITGTQHGIAEDRYQAVGKHLSRDNGAFASVSPTIYPQGSFQIGTTVKPLREQEYDLDIVCELGLAWTQVDPEEVLKAFERDLMANKIYASIMERKNRCIRLNYANEFHMDILPACPNGTYHTDGNVKVPDRAAHEWKDSNPKGFAAWFNGRSEQIRTFAAKAEMQPLPPAESAERKLPLKRAVQLMKRHRDVVFKDKTDYAPISIVLSTVAGLHYQGELSVASGLKRILEAVVASLPPSDQRLIVLNPTNPKEDLSERWNDKPEAYKVFVEWIKKFRQTWSLVESATNKVNLSNILGAMFGEEVTNESFREQAAFMEKARRDKLIGVSQGTGLITLDSPIRIPIRENTFYGKKFLQ
jgi:hypothetical protein